MKNRNMFYQNIQEGYNNPGMFVPPSGYNMNYQAYGPNQVPLNQTNEFETNYEERISKLERQVKVLDNRLLKLENASIDTTNDNIYMI